MKEKEGSLLKFPVPAARQDREEGQDRKEFKVAVEEAGPVPEADMDGFLADFGVALWMERVAAKRCARTA